jgi:hypothetical protein
MLPVSLFVEARPRRMRPKSHHSTPNHTTLEKHKIKTHAPLQGEQGREIGLVFTSGIPSTNSASPLLRRLGQLVLPLFPPPILPAAQRAKRLRRAVPLTLSSRQKGAPTSGYAATCLRSNGGNVQASAQRPVDITPPQKGGIPFLRPNPVRFHSVELRQTYVCKSSGRLAVLLFWEEILCP